LGKTPTCAARVLREMKVGVLVVVVGLWGSQDRKVRKVPLMFISV
jgi:hypothetical protein